VSGLRISHNLTKKTYQDPIFSCHFAHPGFQVKPGMTTRNKFLWIASFYNTSTSVLMNQNMSLG